MPKLFDEINKKYKNSNRIYSIIFEVTHRCPCDCAHCYLSKNLKDELSTEEIADLFHQACLEGVFDLDITGGEPFLRKDFPKILKLARDERFFIYIQTTGILIERPEVKLLQEMKISSIQLSLLGANHETHDSIMNYPGAFKRIMRAAKLLIDAGIRVYFSATIMKQNWKELSAMKKIAKDLGTTFKASTEIIPRIDGNLSPLAIALNEEEIEKINPFMVSSSLIPEEKNRKGTPLSCNAGKIVACVSPQGDIFPCTIFRLKVGNIREHSLKHIWHDDPLPILNELRELRPEEIKKCFKCELKKYCSRCPGVAYIETGEIRKPSPSACIYAKGTARAYNIYE